MIKVLVVEDSAVSRAHLVHVLEKDPEISVIGTAGDGEEAIALAAREKPDVITMDIHMPKLDGIEATRRIMETNPVPIIIVSASWSPTEVATTFRAVEAGAVALVEKPLGAGNALAPRKMRASLCRWSRAWRKCGSSRAGPGGTRRRRRRLFPHSQNSPGRRSFRLWRLALRRAVRRRFAPC